MRVRDVICQRILPDSSLLPGTQTALPGSEVFLMPAESGSLHQPALSAMGMVAGCTGMAKRLPQDPAEATGAPPDEKQLQEGPTAWGFALLLCSLLWACLAFYKDN